jgi:hypothetical protein
MSARIELLESNMLNMQLRTRFSDVGVDGKKSADNDSYKSLLTVWDSLGVPSEERLKTSNDIQKEKCRLEEEALNKAQNTLYYSQKTAVKLQKNLSLICSALGEKEDGYFIELLGIPSVLPLTERLSSMSALSRLSTLTAAFDIASSSMTALSKNLWSFQERLFTTMQEMWLETADLPESLRLIAGLDLKAMAPLRLSDSDEEGDTSKTDRSNSAVNIAEQLFTSGLSFKHTEAYDRELRVITILKAQLSQQIFQIRAEIVEIYDVLGLDESSLLVITGADGSGCYSEAQQGAVSTVVLKSISSPIGNKQIFEALISLKTSLLKVQNDRNECSVLITKFSNHLNMILDGDERENVDTENVALDMEIKMIGNIKDRSLIVKNNLIIEFNSYMKAIGNEPSDDSESYENMIQGLLEQGAKTKSVSVCGLDNDLQNVLKVMADSRDEQISVLVNSVLASWGPLGGNLPDINIESGRCLILQISFLRVEVLRL